LRQIEAEVTANIKQHVMQVVQWPEDARLDHAQLVSVTTFQHATALESGRLASADHHQTWLDEHGTTLGVAVLGLMSLLAVRWIVRSSSLAGSTNEGMKRLNYRISSMTAVCHLCRALPGT
jgi:hypothetical protein